MSVPPQTINVTESHDLLDCLRVQTGTRKQIQRGLRNYCMACVMLDAGLRVGELVQLVNSDLFFNGAPVRTIVIRPAITKTKMERTVPVSERLSNSLIDYVKHCKFVDLSSPSAFVFRSSTKNRRLTSRQVERFIFAASMKAIGRPIHPHVLRHTFASKLMRVTNASTVQVLLGHKCLSSTQIYCHPNEQDKRQAIDSAVDLPGQRTFASLPASDPRPGPALAQ